MILRKFTVKALRTGSSGATNLTVHRLVSSRYTVFWYTDQAQRRRKTLPRLFYLHGILRSKTNTEAIQWIQIIRT